MRFFYINKHLARAGVPTVVYGYFAALTVAPAVRDFAVMLGVSNAASDNALAAGIVMGVMIIPLVSSMSDDSIAAVPNAMRDGSLAMGATKSETIKKVLLPAALPGVVGGVLLAVSRAIGDTIEKKRHDSKINEAKIPSVVRIAINDATSNPNMTTRSTLLRARKSGFMRVNAYAPPANSSNNVAATPIHL